VIILDAHVVVKGKKYVFQGQPSLDKNSFQNSNVITIKDDFIYRFTMFMEIKNKKTSEDSIIIFKKKLKIKFSGDLLKRNNLSIIDDN
jgi:hypothetical protein